ncbi:hypothetical protein K503DRAFT_785473 [Rhizopogon vinicolor AM-OR11-026]|uniref:Mid2 domain-containing protein n=1 Tax=Rhizopogon vinicolor AM-OR11-026 TaxID=1314800 RepID=A0A1B7MQH8_9AGAM|nr:hypothetical protein K503DRAFT_785473 [Rhizopogon vinicolor AM-OR11-026]
MQCPSWSSNTKGQTPCQVVQQVDNACKYTYDTISPPSSEVSFVPAGSNVTQCTCSWASYNLLSACMYCASSSPALVSWDQWTINCGDMTSTTYFPSGITSNLSIPYYANYDPSTYTNGTFSTSIASGLSAASMPDLTGDPVPSTSSSSGSSSSSSTTPMAAIVGGVIGGVVLLLLFCGFFLFIFCRRRKRSAQFSQEMTSSPWNGSHFTVAATKNMTRAPLAPSGYPQTSAPMSTSPYSPHRMPHMPSTTSLSSLRIASPTSPGHGMPLSPSVLPMSSPINDAADVISPFLAQTPSRPANTLRNEKGAPVTPETTPERATSPQSPRSRMNPPPYVPSSPSSSHARSGSNASRGISISKHFRQGSVSGGTSISSMMGNKKRPHARRMRTEGSIDSTRSMATTASVSDNGAGRNIRTTLERTTTSAASRGPAV